MKNLKIFVVALVAALCAIPAAQAMPFNLGVAAGINNAKYRFSGMPDAVDNKSGFQVGVTASIKVPLISVSPEIWYSKNSFSVVNPTLPYGSTGEVTSKSVDVPVLAGLSIIPFITLELGPSFSLYNNATMTLDGSGEEVDLGSIREDMGYVCGVKLKLPILSSITVGARYNGQFGGVDKVYNDMPYIVRTSSYSIYAGFKF